MTSILQGFSPREHSIQGATHPHVLFDERFEQRVRFKEPPFLEEKAEVGAKVLDECL
jgi:hypothetical protein